MKRILDLSRIAIIVIALLSNFNTYAQSALDNKPYVSATKRIADSKELNMAYIFMDSIVGNLLHKKFGQDTLVGEKKKKGLFVARRFDLIIDYQKNKRCWILGLHKTNIEVDTSDLHGCALLFTDGYTTSAFRLSQTKDTMYFILTSQNFLSLADSGNTEFGYPFSIKIVNDKIVFCFSDKERVLYAMAPFTITKPTTKKEISEKINLYLK